MKYADFENFVFLPCRHEQQLVPYARQKDEYCSSLLTARIMHTLLHRTSEYPYERHNTPKPVITLVEMASTGITFSLERKFSTY
jgi:hypothetical protein